MDQPGQSISSLIGREMYSKNGTYVGEIEDLRLDIHGEAVTGLAVTHLNPDLFEDEVPRSGFLLPYRWVRAVGDVVIVIDLENRLSGIEREKVPA